MDKDLLRDRFTGQAMNPLLNVGVLLVAAALIGAMGSTTSLLQNQASAQGVSYQNGKINLTNSQNNSSKMFQT